jgi:hypothetical protein
MIPRFAGLRGSMIIGTPPAGPDEIAQAIKSMPMTCSRKTPPTIIEDLSFGVEEETTKEDPKNEERPIQRRTNHRHSEAA